MNAQIPLSGVLRICSGRASPQAAGPSSLGPGPDFQYPGQRLDFRGAGLDTHSQYSVSQALPSIFPETSRYRDTSSGLQSFPKVNIVFPSESQSFQAGHSRAWQF